MVFAGLGASAYPLSIQLCQHCVSTCWAQLYRLRLYLYLSPKLSGWQHPQHGICDVSVPVTRPALGVVAEFCAAEAGTARRSNLLDSQARQVVLGLGCLPVESPDALQDHPGGIDSIGIQVSATAGQLPS